MGIWRGNSVVTLRAGLFFVMVSSGCTVGPHYTVPHIDTPEQWVGSGAPVCPAAPADIARLARWWDAFGDATLQSLIERALMANLDIQRARARIQEARATKGVVASGLWPSAELKGAYTRYRSPANAPGRVIATTANLFQTGLDAVWELDLFGGRRRSIEAAEADIEVAIEDARDVMVTLAAEVALNYIDLRSAQEQLRIATRTLKAHQHAADLTRMRCGAGLVSAMDVARAEALVATTASDIPAFEATARQSIYSISVLLGLEPAALDKELSEPSSIPTAPPHVPMVLPSELLERRPDVRRALASFHGATARIGIAKADLFPKFNLVGSGGFQGAALRDWLSWQHRTWSVGPAIDWQIFTAGKVRSAVKAYESAQEQSLLQYKKTVLQAFREIEDALAAYAGEQARNKALSEAVAAHRKTVDLAVQLYTEGMTEFLNVLDAQRSLYASEEALAQSTRNLSRNVVALYKALGGGWEEAHDGEYYPLPTYEGR